MGISCCGSHLTKQYIFFLNLIRYLLNPLFKYLLELLCTFKVLISTFPHHSLNKVSNSIICLNENHHFSFQQNLIFVFKLWKSKGDVVYHISKNLLQGVQKCHWNVLLKQFIDENLYCYTFITFSQSSKTGLPCRQFCKQFYSPGSTLIFIHSVL